jgi:hypothetical protein
MKTTAVLVSILLLLNACELLFYKDEPTKVKGYVIDTLTKTRVAHAKIYLVNCYQSFPGPRCEDLVDSTFTDANGNYEFNFSAIRRKGYGVIVADYPINKLYYQKPSSDPNSKPRVTKGHYRVSKGTDNIFNFEVTQLKTLHIRLMIGDTDYQNLIVHTSFDEFILPGRANNLDTVLYAAAIPENINRVSSLFLALDKPARKETDSVYVGMADTTMIRVNY